MAVTNMPMPERTPDEIFCAEPLQAAAFHSTQEVLLFNEDSTAALRRMADAGLEVDCIVTSPPFYGQRDYEVDGQIGLELNPAEFIEKLVAVFELCWEVLKPTGSLWVNMGDTYWSGKGQHRSSEKKQSARRFGLRPQDRKGDGEWCRPKQLLLIPHRFAIAMQDAGWLVRNDNIWVKPNPIPDQVRDRCSMSHEFVFHFTKERWYWFDRAAVGRKQPGRKRALPPLDTWAVPTSKGRNGSHRASFSKELVRIPILGSCPEGGVVLDPFAGSGTTLEFAVEHNRRAVGIDLKQEFCELMRENLAESQCRLIG